MERSATSVTSAFLSLALLATELLGGPVVDGDPISATIDQRVGHAQPMGAAAQPEGQPLFVDGQRQRHVEGPLKRGIHELRDPSGWPAEPAAVAGALDPARFEAAVVAVCGEVAPDAGLPELARLVREAAAETHADAFLLAALAYRESRCRPGLVTATGVGLLQIQPKMFAKDARLPFPHEALEKERLLDPAANLRVGAALLEMWTTEHAALDAASGSTPHRTAIAHFVWGDRVWSATAEDRTLVARRRLMDLYAGAPLVVRPSPLGLDIVSPLEGGIRLGTSGPGADRDDGKRAHRGLDVDATVGEPVRAVADGVVQFAGLDLPGQLPAREVLPRQIKRFRNKRMGPGGFFVRINHADGIRSGYFHLTSFRVVIGQAVKAGEVIGTVGRSGIKVSGSHLHFEVHKDGELGDPVAFLSAFVLPPSQTITHELAMAEKHERLARVRRVARRRARAERAAAHAAASSAPAHAAVTTAAPATLAFAQ
jgi:murein DD-endopeptidase MepM/ murein hydrolase activator NlpD